MSSRPSSESSDEAAQHSPEGAGAAAIDPDLLNDILEWDVHGWSQALHFWEGATPWSRVNNCLELGARRGGLALWLASKGKQVVCSDYGGVPPAAMDRHRRHNVQDRITYQDIDVTAIPHENQFDLVAFKSVLGALGDGHGIEGQRRAVAEMHKALKPGGVLLFAENLVASPLHRVARRMFVSWAAHWRYITTAEMRSFLAPFSDYQLHTTGVLATFGRNERQRRLLARLDRGLLNHVTPSNWRYIVYGVATK